MQTAKITAEGIALTDGEDLDRPVKWKDDGTPISAMNRRQNLAAAGA